VYRCETEDLAGRYLSEYTLHRMNVALTDEEKVEYEKNYNVFKDYLASRGIRLTTSVEFQKFVMRSARDRDARQA
ncbi:MAG: ATP-dependent helicase, partial [Nitrososphaeria archaeon]|nr:ATP-dependent helicase [Nitrososphaeria archaeon]